jgi:hypothetical protein
MKRLTLTAALSLLILVLTALSCSLPAQLLGDAANLAKTTELWGDVPRMDGLEASDMDLPLYAKVLVQTVMSKVLSGGTGSGDWIVFTTDKTPEDLTAFYTNDRMAENGWEASDTSTCVEGSAQGLTEAGVFCVFQKREGNHYTGLMIIGGEDAQAEKTNIIFIRVEAEETPEPGNQ